MACALKVSLVLFLSSASSSLDEDEDEDEEELLLPLLEEEELLLEDPDWSSLRFTSSKTTVARSGRCSFRTVNHLADILGLPLQVCFHTCSALATTDKHALYSHIACTATCTWLADNVNSAQNLRQRSSMIQ